MLELKHFRRSFLILLLIATLSPMACRQLVMLMVRTRVVYLNLEGSICRSLRRPFSRNLLYQLDCQTVKKLSVVSVPKSNAVLLCDFPKNIEFEPAFKNVFGNSSQSITPPESFLPLRI